MVGLSHKAMSIILTII